MENEKENFLEEYKKEYQEDLMPLHRLLIEQEIPCEMRLHPGAEPRVKELIGYYPTGTHQILIKKDGTTYSVIRGMTSFGNYEIMNIGDKGRRYKDPERFETPEELIKSLLEG